MASGKADPDFASLNPGYGYSSAGGVSYPIGNAWFFSACSANAIHIDDSQPLVRLLAKIKHLAAYSR